MRIGTRTILFVVAFVIRLLFLWRFGDTYHSTGRMIPLYNMAANWADTGHFYLDEAFARRAGLLTYHSTPKRNIDYKKLRSMIPVSPKYNTHPEITDTWGYAALLGFVWRITGDKSYRYIQFVQIAMDSLATLMIYSVLIQLFGGRTAAIIGSYAYALFPPFALLTVMATREQYAAWGAITSLFFFVKGLYGEKKTKYWILSGSSLAFFSWFRSTIFLLPLAYVSWLLLTERSKGISLVLKAACLTGLPILLLFVVPLAHQYKGKYGTYNFTVGIGGASLWMGMGRFSHKYQFRRNDRQAIQRAIELGYPPDAPYFTPHFGRLLRGDAMRVIKQDPGFYITNVARRYVRFLFARPPYPLSERYQISFAESGLTLSAFAKRYPAILVEKAVKTIMVYLVPLLAILAFLFYADRWRQVLLLMAVWQYRILIFVFVYLEDRFIMECYFPVVVLATMTSVQIFRKRDYCRRILKYALSRVYRE